MSDILEMLSDPHARHAMLVHFPIVLGLLGIVPVIALVVTRFKSQTLKIVAISCYLLMSAGAGLAASAGEEAEEHVEDVQPGLTEVEDDAIEEHEELGEGGWMWPLIPAVLIGVTFLKDKRVRIGGGALAIIASAGVAGWIGLTAHSGGTLVYVHGLGVPERGQGGHVHTDSDEHEADDDDDDDDD